MRQVDPNPYAIAPFVTPVDAGAYVFAYEGAGSGIWGRAWSKLYLMDNSFHSSSGASVYAQPYLALFSRLPFPT